MDGYATVTIAGTAMIPLDSPLHDVRTQHDTGARRLISGATKKETTRWP